MTEPKSKAEEITRIFEFEKSTPHSVRLKEITEEGEAPIMGTIYFRDWWIGSCNKVEVTIKKL